MDAAREENGAVLVEFAVVLPVLIMLLVGFLKLGLAMNAKIDSTHLTAEGARFIVVNQNPATNDASLSPQTIQNYVRSRADSSFLRSAKVCVAFVPNSETGTSGKVGDPVRVTMSHTLTILPLLSALGSSLGDLPIDSEATMRLEALPTRTTAGCLG